MFEIKTVLLLFGIVFLLLAATRKVLRKQQAQPVKKGKLTHPQASGPSPRMTEEQFNRSWKSLSYLILLAAAGNGYMLYKSVTGALETQSYILWIDAVFSLIAGVVAVLIWRKHTRDLVLAYMVITVIPIMIFISTNHALDGLVRLFPLVLVYFVIQPVWEYMNTQANAAA